MLLRPGFSQKEHHRVRAVGRAEGQETPAEARIHNLHAGSAGASGLKECGVTHVALESTGVYWKPVWNVLEGQFEILLVNAQHIKAVPGRKTDQKDSEWIADLLQHGLLRGSFVPPRETREMRDLTRYRVSMTEECNRIANRIQKVLEDANIKLAFGGDGRFGSIGARDAGGHFSRGARCGKIS